MDIQLTHAERLIVRLLAAGDRESLAAAEFARVVLDETEGDETVLYAACSRMIEMMRAIKGAVKTEMYERAKALTCDCAGPLVHHAPTCPRFGDDHLPQGDNE